MSLASLAHELNSLLDGSMRYVGLARRHLSGERPVPGTDAGALLESALDGLGRMTEVLERAMSGSVSTVRLFEQARPLGETLPAMVELVRPLAADLGVELSLAIAPGAAAKPSGLAEPVVVNGLRNAIRAASAAPEGERRVELDVALVGGDVEIVVRDSGPGLRHAADVPSLPRHGLGLELCRQIVAGLGGAIELRGREAAAGAALTVRLPAGGPS